MPAGGNRKGAGRKKGTPNKATIEFKEALNNLLNHAAPHMIEWLDKIAQDDPAKAMDTISKYVEYIHPKLARQDMQALDKDGKPTDLNLNVTIK